MERKKILIISVIAIFLILVISLFIILGKPKPDPVSVQCKFFCDTNQKAGFCSFEIQVNNNLRTNCNELSKNSQYTKYNVEPCSAISCAITAQEADQTCVTGLGGKWELPIGENTCPQSGDKIVRKINSSDESPVAGQICCR
jgi:hypothetical protein